MAGADRALAQSAKLSTEPSAFSSDVVNMMQEGNNLRMTELGAEFNSLWVNGKFNSGQQEQVIAIAQKMVEKRFKLKPHFDNFFSFLVTGSKTTNVDLTKLLTTTEKVIDVYSNKEILNYLSASRSFLTEQAIYTSSYNNLFSRGGSYHFEFIEAVEPEPVAEEAVEEEAPEEEEKDEWFDDWDEEGGEDNWDTSWDEEPKEQAVSEVVLPGADIQTPDVNGAIIRFENVNLTMVTPYDSVTLHQTSGSFMLTKNLFVGSGGRFDWSIAGLDPQEVYCEFDKYFFRCRSASNSSGKRKNPLS